MMRTGLVGNSCAAAPLAISNAAVAAAAATTDLSTVLFSTVQFSNASLGVGAGTLFVAARPGHHDGMAVGVFLQSM
jgi:hypothetical protein